MRFASLSGSNTSDYAAAGKTVADSAAKTFAIQRKTGPDYGELSKVAMKTNTEEKIAAINASAKVAQAGINAYTDVTLTGQKVAVQNKLSDIKAKQRKAGGIAALGKIAAAGFLSASDNDKNRPYPTADRKGFDDAYQADVKKLLADNKSKRESIYSESDAASASLRSKYNSPTESSDTSTSDATNVAPISETKPGKVTTDESPKTPTVSKLSIGSDSSNNPLSGLTSKDFDDMAYTISSEAALGTDDVYGVGANLLTRLRSGKYGDTIHAISHAPGQYEGVYTGRSVASPKISAQLQSAEGRQKLIDAFNRLDGRTEFKGQSMLKNRVAAEDPMFHSRGNFYHYAGQ
jgi:hypothetical protein